MDEPGISNLMSTAVNMRKRLPIDDYDPQRSPKRQAVDGENGEPEYADNFAQHLQDHIQAGDGPSSAHIANGHSPDVQSGPYPTAEPSQNGFELSETNHQGTPYGGFSGYKHVGENEASNHGMAATPRSKPVVGTAEWHQNRKDCHKEVERRRRETINEGIMALASIVPDCEKAKGAILNRAVAYVHDLRNTIDTLQNDHAQTKGTLEGLLAQMTAANSELRADNEAGAREIARLKAKLQNAGISDEE